MIDNDPMIERLKFHKYAGRAANRYFGQTNDQKEIGLVEEQAGKLYGFEFGWKATSINKESFYPLIPTPS